MTKFQHAPAYLMVPNFGNLEKVFTVLSIIESAVFVSLVCSLFPDDLHSLQLVLYRVAAVKCYPIHHHSADYIFSGLSESLESF